MERRRHRKGAIFWAIGVLVLLFGCWIWHRGSPYQNRYYSPNGRFYLQKYSNFTLSRLSVASIGGGSATFGDALDWQNLSNRNGCRICKELPGGWKEPESECPAMQDRMIDALIRLDSALRKPIQALNV